MVLLLMRAMSQRFGLVVRCFGPGARVLGVIGRCHRMRCTMYVGGRLRMWR